jgi:hypothetical protein
MATDSDSPAPAAKPYSWTDHAARAAATLHTSWSHPRVRLGVAGAVLLLLGWFVLTNSVWTLPLVLIGAVMVALAWIGHRLEGRFAIEWGTGGTQVDFRARIAAPQELPPALPSPPATVAPPRPHDDEVIEGEAHTVEIDVAQLKTLIAAVETTTNGTKPPEATADAIRILRVAADREP